MKRLSRIFVICLASFSLCPLVRADLSDMLNIRGLIKIIGIGGVVHKFGPQINHQLNKLTNHIDTPEQSTKVVPILRTGLGRESAIGAAQVMGPKRLVDTVKAVIEPELRIFGGLSARALIPVASYGDIKSIHRVAGVGVSGILDLRL